MDTTLTTIIQQGGPQALFDHLFGTKYLPAHQEKLREDIGRKTDAFADDATFMVCGEEVRLMTPHDFVLLDGQENPFITGGDEVTPQHFVEFLWVLAAENNPAQPIRNAYRAGRMATRVTNYLETHDTFECVAEVMDYIDRIFLDHYSDGKAGNAQQPQRSHTVHDIAPLLVSACAAVGPNDPMNSRPLGRTPIPRLIQYNRAANKAQGGKEVATAIDSLKSRCLEEVNTLMAEYARSQQENK